MDFLSGLSTDFWVEFGMSSIGVIMASASIPQIVRLIRRKKSDDISIVSWVWLLFGQISWLGYGIYKKSPSLIITEIAWIIAAITILTLSIKYRPWYRVAYLAPTVDTISRIIKYRPWNKK